jgi:hypothetical protein
MLTWLIPHLEKWPRPQRFFLAKQVLDQATEFYQLLLYARKVAGPERANVLLKADVALETLKGLVRLGQELEYMSLRQYEYISEIFLRLGQQLGGWRKATEKIVES